jgi:hypothetical protein
MFVSSGSIDGYLKLMKQEKGRSVKLKDTERIDK